MFIVNFFVFGHVGLVAEIVKVTRVGLRVEFGHEWCALFPEIIPVYFGEVDVRVDLRYTLEAGRFGGDAAGVPDQLGSTMMATRTADLPFDEVPCPLAEEVTRILEYGFSEHLLPMFQVLPSFFDCGSGKRWVACNRFKEHTT